MLEKLDIPYRTRGLTPGEVAMARLMFRDAIDYAKVRVHAGGLYGWPDRQDSAMAPRGEIHFPQTRFTQDYSLLDEPEKMWFMHEMTHVWQFQLGYSVLRASVLIALSGGYRDRGMAKSAAYCYDLKGLDRGKAFSDFNMEQQGELVAQYFASRHLHTFGTQPQCAELSLVLDPLLRNPESRALLPRTSGPFHRPQRRNSHL